MRTLIHARHEHRGQALVEFSLALIVFLVLLMGILDLGRGIYTFNGVSQAAREIARVTSVYPGGVTLGTSTQTTTVVNTQKGLIPNLGSPTFACLDIDGSAGELENNGKCKSGMQVKVTVSAKYGPVTPILGLVGTWDMSATSSVQLP